MQDIGRFSSTRKDEEDSQSRQKKKISGGRQIAPATFCYLILTFFLPNTSTPIPHLPGFVLPPVRECTVQHKPTVVTRKQESEVPVDQRENIGNLKQPTALSSQLPSQSCSEEKKQLLGSTCEWSSLFNPRFTLAKHKTRAQGSSLKNYRHPGRLDARAPG